jgi:hypothetical protein
LQNSLSPTEAKNKKKTHSNFTFQIALRSPMVEDKWAGHSGFTYEVVLAKGPSIIIKARKKMIADFVVPIAHIPCDDF